MVSRVRFFLPLFLFLPILLPACRKLPERRDLFSPFPIKTAKQRGMERGRIYRRDGLAHVAMPMGGIGAGSIALCGDGALRQWQIFNNVYEPARLPYSFFALFARERGKEGAARVLQKEPVGSLPNVSDTEFVGEYPVAWIDFVDPKLPVHVSLESYSPFIPLNEKDSALPAVVYNFHISNPGKEPVTGSLAAMLQNGVGYDGLSEVKGFLHPGFRGNRNRLVEGEAGTAILMETTEGTADAFEGRVRIWTNLRLLDDLFRGCRNAQVSCSELHGSSFLERPDVLARNFPLIWLDDFSSENPPEWHHLNRVREAVHRGSTLIISGTGYNSLKVIEKAKEAATHPSQAFEDFEDGTLKRWVQAGSAFGEAPLYGSAEGQRWVSGWEGCFYANSFHPNDQAKGILVSPPFTLQHRFIHFLLGCGDYPETLYMCLKVDGRVVRKASNGREVWGTAMKRMHWDVAEFLGREVQIEVVDREDAPMGHILVDDIRFSDSPVSPPSEAALQELEEMLPFRFRSLEVLEGKIQIPLPAGLPFSQNIQAQELRLSSTFLLSPVSLRPEAQAMLAAKNGTPLIVHQPYGKGRVVVLNFPLEGILDPHEMRILAANLAAFFGGTRFVPGSGHPRNDPSWGDLSLATPIQGVEYAVSIHDLEDFWENFSRGRILDDGRERGASPRGRTWCGALAVPFVLAPGEETVVPFVLSWHFPNHYYRRGPHSLEPNFRVGNRYNAWFSSSLEAAEYVLQNFHPLREETLLFHDSLFQSTLPYPLLDAVSSQISTLRSQTVMWLEDGTIAAFEGCAERSGCCPMNCCHVYNYAQAAAALFPSLERNMRHTDFTVQMEENGLIHFRAPIPFNEPHYRGDCADGQFGTVLKAYREHLRTSDALFLETYWPKIARAMEYGIRKWDGDQDGMVGGSQHNTYDINLQGPNPFIQSLYLAALRAAEEMAGILQKKGDADRYRTLFEKGREKTESHLWNGEYYVQRCEDAVHTPWQMGEGCLADQLLGQWWAHILNLGYLFPAERVRQAMASVYRYNWLERVEGFPQWPRVFANAQEAGLLNCSWPKGGKPPYPLLYSDEVWTGIEYMVASFLLYEGMAGEAFHMVEKVRERYSGSNRNPWSEIECGGHYARAMSSWILLLASEGFSLDGPEAKITFRPKIQQENFRAFFSAPEGWGSFRQVRSQREQMNTLQVQYGNVVLRFLTLSLPQGGTAPVEVAAYLGEKLLEPQWSRAGTDLTLDFNEKLEIPKGEALKVTVSWL